jgi:hypothetical protein
MQLANKNRGGRLPFLASLGRVLAAELQDVGQRRHDGTD